MSAPDETVIEDLRNALQLLTVVDGGHAAAAVDRIRSALAKLEVTPDTCPECYNDRQLVAPMARDEPVPGQRRCIWCGFVDRMAAAA